MIFITLFFLRILWAIQGLLCFYINFKIIFCGFYPGFFHNTASALGLRVGDILCASFQNLVFISYSLVSLPKVSPASPSKSNVLGTHLLGERSQSRGTQGGAWIPCSLWRTSKIILLCMRCPSGAIGLVYTPSMSLFLISFWLLFLIFSCGISFLLDFRLFSSVFAL